MIKIIFPPGTYGHFLAKCLCGFTNLCPEVKETFSFGSSSSNHDIRHALHETRLANLLKVEHLDTYRRSHDDRVIIILPMADHYLDYYDNQYFKQEKANVIRSILTQVSIDDANQKLKDHWGYRHGLDENTPRWIIREWFSFFATQVWRQGYDTIPYQQVSHVAELTTHDLFVNLRGTIGNLCHVLGLEITVDDDFIETQQNLFNKSQQFHNRQLQCDSWCQSVLNDQASSIDGLTIFDEAYIQYKIRLLGKEIKCDSLERLPECSTDMNKLIF